MDADNPVVQLCIQGIEAESSGRPQEAAALFDRAWSRHRDGYEGCIAAHYVARQQSTPAEAYRWNAESLRLAQTVGDDRVRPFYPSLYLNMGPSCEQAGETAEALTCYRAAADRLHDLEPGPLSDMVRRGVMQGLNRITAATTNAPGPDGIPEPNPATD